MKLTGYLIGVILFASCVPLKAHLNPDWDGDCEKALYQTFKKFQDSVKKYEHTDPKDLTAQESAELEKILNELMSESAEIITQCALAYEFNLLQRVHGRAKDEGREDVASLVGATYKNVEEFWETISLNDL